MQVWLYGWHACVAALENKERKIYRICLADEKKAQMLSPLRKNLAVEIVDKAELGRLLSQGKQAQRGREQGGRERSGHERGKQDSGHERGGQDGGRSFKEPVHQNSLHQNFGHQNPVHQNIAVQVETLPRPPLSLLSKFTQPNQCVIVLDQVTDPHNIGAIMRSMAVFGASALVTADRHTPGETAVLVKAASGAFDRIPWITVTNLAQAIEELQRYGFWCYGLSEKGDQNLFAMPLDGKIALVLGSEGEGMRRLTAAKCDGLVHLPSAGSFSTLNVSNAVAVSLALWFKGIAT